MITVDAEKIKVVEQRLGELRKQAPVAIYRALNRAAANAKTNASKKVRETYTLRAKDVNETFSVRKASRNSLVAVVSSRSGSIGLDKFKVRPLEPRHKKPPKSLKVQVKKEGGAKNLIGGFVASVSGNKVFQREKSSRHKKGGNDRWTELPIKRLFGPPVPEMLERKSIREFVEQEAAQTFEKNLEHEIKRALEGNS